MRGKFAPEPLVVGGLRPHFFNGVKLGHLDPVLLLVIGELNGLRNFYLRIVTGIKILVALLDFIPADGGELFPQGVRVAAGGHGHDF